MTLEEKIIATGYTGVSFIKDFGIFHAEAERRLGRAILTHEHVIPEVAKEVKAAFRQDFIAMCNAE